MDCSNRLRDLFRLRHGLVEGAALLRVREIFHISNLEFSILLGKSDDAEAIVAVRRAVVESARTRPLCQGHVQRCEMSGRRKRYVKFDFGDKPERQLSQAPQSLREKRANGGGSQPTDFKAIPGAGYALPFLSATQTWVRTFRTVSPSSCPAGRQPWGTTGMCNFLRKKDWRY